MNILFLLGLFPNIGGVESVSIILANEFVKRGHRVHFASFEQNQGDENRFLDPTIHLLRLNYPVLGLSNIRQLRKYIKGNNINVIINQWCLPFYVTFLCRIALRGLNCKLIAVHHNSPDSNTLVNGVKLELEKSNLSWITQLALSFKFFLAKQITSKSMCLVYHLSDKYILLSESFKQVFKDFTGIKDTRNLAVITNPITIIDPNPEKTSVKENIILYVGRLEHNQKRAHRVLDSWKLLERKYPLWKLVIVGDGPDKESLLELKHHYNLKNVEFTGFTDPVEYYKRSSILLLTSEYEGLGLVVIEAQKFGVVPVVYGSYASVYDIITPMFNGEILPNQNGFSPFLMAKKIENIINDNTFWNKLSKGAITSSDDYKVEKIASEWIELFNK